ncbi:fluoride efflux transporter CrcB [Ferirhizobium litorale]|uniref:Fluoride-specific ion channel FluC n=1 Tax=Ferirhizobium litorale TaxID=2927786 RepID=A0AAE3U3W4_9HYPH|nr:fluoride efflux transporter CrcB [Fererhizobium litorale]MDI7922394.1 fluoride efflux transporter CrcB [Fererhizobium litorale]
MSKLLGMGFPFGTLTVNMVGSITMGALAALFVLKAGVPQELKPFLTTGLLGGFTTFSTFSLDAVTLWQRGQTSEAIVYVGSSLALSMAGLVVGMMVVRWFLEQGAVA